MSTAVLECADVEVAYGAVQAVRGVSLHIEPSEAVALLGANGAGKSSLISALVGLPLRGGGTVHLGARDVTRHASYRRVKAGLAVVPEGRRVTGTLSIEENLELGAFWSGKARRAETKKLVWEIFPHLYDRRAQAAGTLSGGEQQMLAIGRAIMSEPRVVLMDEPTMGLAPKIVGDVLEAIRNIMAERELSMLIAEQNAHAALAICTRGYLMKDGLIVHEGSSSELVSSGLLASMYLS
ncbi:MAG: branched-chain amino acid transport system ATP-binding protein [Baekduia sp.]|jgi:branched-chain amino acid transport system ATP-binding protein|nr:branched-chain amino acid transport system ATP-binding protein [Baekduia sp.]